MEYLWGHSRRFNSYAEYFKRYFGHRVQKLTIDAGFTCPNRDGTVASGGCTYCNNDSFNPSYNTVKKSITQQLSEGVEFHEVRYRTAKTYLAYFQPYSNTYDSLKRLKELYSEALSFPGVAGLVIGTRPDCVDAEKLDYFQELSEKYYISVEYGLETLNDKVLNEINRGHDTAKSFWAIEETAKRGIKTGAHFIIGLPGDPLEDFLSYIPIISKLPLNSIKFHQLQIIKSTAMAIDYKLYPEKYQLFNSLETYLDFLVQVTERLNPGFILERIAAETPPRYLVAPNWGLIRIVEITRMFEKMLETRNTWQGKYYE